VNLKIIEVVVLVLAGVLFVTWQFRDLRRAKEITRLQREAEKRQAMQRTANSDDVPSVTPSQSERQ
jgi:uncharacterized ion transporter superfamily protein YfcC